MAYQITKTVSASKGNTLHLSNSGKWKLYTDTEQYGKEKTVSEKNLDRMISEGIVKRMKNNYNYALGKGGFHYIVK